MNAKCCEGWTRLVYVGWWLVLALFSYGLLSPDPPNAGLGFLPPWLKYYVSKGVHLGGFASLAAGAVSLAIGPRHRLLLLGALVAWAAVTEYLQTFVEGRHGCVSDVFINLTGVTLGAGLALVWRSRSPAPEPISATTPAT